MTKRLLLALSSAMAFACAPIPNRPGQVPEAPPTAAGPQTEETGALRAKYAKLSQTADSLLRDQDELVWKSWTQGAAVDLAAPYEGRENLFSDANLRALARLQSQISDPMEKRAVSRLRVFIAGELLSRDLAEVSAAVENLRSSMTFSFEGRELAWRDLDRLLAAEANTERRRALYAASQPSAERLGQLVRRKDDQLAKMVPMLGYPSYAAFAADLREADLARMGALASRFLELTDAEWKTVLDQMALRENINPLELSRADFPRLLRPPPADVPFPKGAIQTQAENTLAGMGLSPKDLPNLHMDWADRPGKNPRPLGLPVEVPKDIRISVLPSGGQENQAEVLQELGRMIPYAVSEPAPFALQKLGSAAVSESAGAVFEELPANPAWLQSLAPLRPGMLTHFLAQRSAQELLSIRLDAAYFLYELQLHNGAQEPASLYSTLIGRAYGIPLSAADVRRADSERTDFFAPLDHFRTTLLAAELKAQLQTKFGETWWKKPEAGAYLRGLWRRGNAQTADELVRTMTHKELAGEALLNQLKPYLRAPAPAAAPPPTRPLDEETPPEPYPS